LYATFVKTLAERMAIAPVAGIGDDARAGSTVANAARPETSIVALSGDYVLQISVDRAGKSAEGALQAPLAKRRSCLHRPSRIRNPARSSA
jgi:hypothetical protein